MFAVVSENQSFPGYSMKDNRILNTQESHQTWLREADDAASACYSLMERSRAPTTTDPLALLYAEENEEAEYLL